MNSASPPLPTSRRWIMAAAAVAIHLSIGSVYAFSVWKTPLAGELGWSGARTTPAFSLAILFLGLSAAFLGRWVDCKGPRHAGLTAAILFGAGLAVAAAAVHLRSTWLFYLGYGIVGGVGLGIGYVAPVATLVRWFPDRRGLATGLATMGFGFGAMVAGPLIAQLAPRLGAAATLALMAALYFSVMSLAARVLCTPPADWADRFPAPLSSARRVPQADASPARVLRSLPFCLLWIMFFLNICCGIAVISIADPMAREMAGMSATAAAGMVGLMGLFNGVGRIGWSAVSDRTGRPWVWLLFSLLQIGAFLLLPRLGHPLAFQACVFLILTCYGGGFATAPAYLGDLFGSRHLSAIYGALLTAWAAAGLVGPTLVTLARERTGGYSGAATLFAAALALGLTAHGLMALHARGQSRAEVRLKD